MNSQNTEMIEFPINKYICVKPQNLKNLKISNSGELAAIICFKNYDGKIYFGISDNIFTIIHFEKKFGSTEDFPSFLRVSDKISNNQLHSAIMDLDKKQKFNSKNENNFFRLKIQWNEKNKNNEIIFCDLDGLEYCLDVFEPNKESDSDKSKQERSERSAGTQELKFNDLEQISSLFDFMKKNKTNEIFDLDDDDDKDKY